MSYKLDLSALSGLDRSEHGAITRALQDFFVEAIDAGRLTPGDQLPPTRELAAAAAVNHLTAARVYRRLALLGSGAGSLGRWLFVAVRGVGAAGTRGRRGGGVSHATPCYAYTTLDYNT